MKRLYISGSISDGGTLPDADRVERVQMFNAAEAALREAGFDPINPARPRPDGTESWLDFMRLSLVDISECDGIATLPGYSLSKGARIEVELVMGLGLPVLSVEGWLFQ